MASINDVATLAGVSVKTVSRIMNGFEGVSDKTKEKVQAAMDELEYYPSAAAQSLRGKTSGIVSLITENLTTTPDSYEIVAGIQSICDREGKLLLIGETGGKNENFEKLVDDFRRQNSQAIIFATVFHKETVITTKFKKCPLILVNCYERQTKHPTILPGDERGAYDATIKLIEMGHQRIAYLTLFEDMSAAKLRLKGYCRALKENNIRFIPELIQEGVVHDLNDEFANLEAVVRRMMSLDEKPTAIMCGNDKMAMRLYMIIRGNMGFRIPEDISIVGYDDYHMIADNLLPKLTTVTIPYFKMGQIAAEKAIAQTNEPSVTIIDGDLVVRQSIRNI